MSFDAAAGEEYRISVDGRYFTEFIFFQGWEKGEFDIQVELTTEIGLIYRTDFEVNWEGLLAPLSSTKEPEFSTPGLWESGSVRMVQQGASSVGWAYPFLRMDGYGPLTARMSFRMDSVAASAGWVIGFTSLPLGAGASLLTSDQALAGVAFDGAGVESAVFNFQSGLASTNPIPSVSINQRHFVELVVDGGSGLLSATIDNVPPRSVPFTLSGSRNLLYGPYFLGTPGAGSLVIDNLEVRLAPRALGVQVPFVRTEPPGRSVPTGETLELSAVVGGEGLSYQWFYEDKALVSGGAVSGAQATTLTITGVSAIHSGRYRLVASNSVGQVTTSEALVTVLPPPPPGPTNVVWSLAGVGGRALAGPGDLIAVRHGSKVVGLSALDGGVYWQIPPPAGFLALDMAAVADDGCVVASGWAVDGSRWLLVYGDPASGVLSESFKLDGDSIQVPAVVGDSRQRRLITADSVGGGVYEVGKGWLWRKPELAGLGNRLVPLSRALVGGYTLPDESGVAAYDYATGAVLWRWRFWERPQVGAPSLTSLRWAGSGVIMVDLDRMLVALDAVTGIERWRLPHSGESYGVLPFDGGTVVGGIGSSANPSYQMFYAVNPLTGAQVPLPLSPVVSSSGPFTRPFGLWPAIVLENGGVILRDIEFAGAVARWQMPQGSSQTLVGVSGSGRVIYEGGGGLFAISGSGSPLSTRSPAPAPLGQFVRPGSKGYFDGDRTLLRPARGWAVVRDGALVGIDVFDPGVGYTNRTPVSIIGGGGSGASAEAVMRDDGVLSVVIRNPGAGYTNAPVIRFGPPAYPARIAVAEPQIVNGFIVGVTLKDGGWGYSQPPVVRFVGGNGNGARAIARIDADGRVTAIEVDSPGSGYTTLPAVWIEPPMLPIPELAVERGSRLQFEGLTIGAGYRLQADAGGWTDVGESFVAQETSIGLRGESGRPHRLVRLPMPRTATGTLTVVNGFVVGVTVTDPGSGYLEAPAVIVQDSAGNGARIIAVMQGGQVAGAQVEATGRGYTTGATVRFEAPPVDALRPAEVPELTIRYANVSTNLPYQLHVGPALDRLAPAGPVFTPGAPSGNLRRDMDGDQEFIQLRYVR